MRGAGPSWRRFGVALLSSDERDVEWHTDEETPLLSSPLLSSPKSPLPGRGRAARGAMSSPASAAPPPPPARSRLLLLGLGLLLWSAFSATFRHHHGDAGGADAAAAGAVAAAGGGGVGAAAGAAAAAAWDALSRALVDDARARLDGGPSLGGADGADEGSRAVELDVLASALFGLACCLAGALRSIPSFTSVRGVLALNRATREDISDRASFRRYGVRARALAKRLGGAPY